MHFNDFMLTCSGIVLLIKPKGEITWPCICRQRLRKAPFSAGHTTLPRRGFHIFPLWRPFSKSSVFGDRKRRFSVEKKKDAFSNSSGLVWMGP